MALDIRAGGLRFAPFLHAARKGGRVVGRAPGRRSRSCLHGGRRSGRRRIVRATVPVLRNAGRVSRTATQDIAGNYPGYHASGDDRPNSISYSVSDGIPDSVSYSVSDGVPDRFTVRFCDGVAMTAFQLVFPETWGLKPVVAVRRERGSLSLSLSLSLRIAVRAAVSSGKLAPRAKPTTETACGGSRVAEISCPKAACKGVRSLCKLSARTKS